jgi:hypothetical protein
MAVARKTARASGTHVQVYILILHALRRGRAIALVAIGARDASVGIDVLNAGTLSHRLAIAYVAAGACGADVVLDVFCGGALQVRRRRCRREG